MKLFDCTLRDGANVVGNGFSGALTLSVLKGLLGCGIRDIEFGNAKGIGAYEQLNSPAPLTDLAYMQLAAPYVAEGRLGMFSLAQCANGENIKLAADNGLHFLRIGADAGDGKSALPAVSAVKAAGLTCRYSLMKGYVLGAEGLAAEAKMLQEGGVDVVTIMDSAGTMFPEDVARYVAAMKSELSIPVGFHGHNNLGLSQANALAALGAGADEIDCGLLGMARSVGNCATEMIMAALLRKGALAEYDFFKLLSYLDEELMPAMAQCGYHAAIAPVDIILGMAGCHSMFLGLFKRIAEEENVSLYALIIEVTKKDAKAPGETFIRATASTLPKLS